ncbi:hypothetical protein [Streptomyces salinarius]|uniref:S1 motif domain-containing protein n=1 Tax=Streptomyces salinarius TaxID=2762598 RepID=A0ABW8BLY7_9ACTN
MGEVMVLAGQTPETLARGRYGPGRSLWYDYKNGSKDIPLALLQAIIRELAPPADRPRLLEQAALYSHQARSARAGEGVLSAQQKPAFPIVVEAVAEVIWGSAESVFVRDTANVKRTGELRVEHLAWDETIPEDISVRYPPGYTLDGQFVTDEDGTHFSRQHGQISPWHQWVRIYQPGAQFLATVSKITSKGDVFVVLEHGGVSRIANTQVTADLAQGSQLQVTIRSILPKQRCINVTRSASRVAASPTAELPLEGCPESRDRMWATVVRPKPDKAFILLDLDGYPQLPGNSAAMLYHTAMSTPLKESLLTGQVSMGDRVFVEVLLVRPDLKRPGKVQVHVREIPPPPGSGLPMGAIAPVPGED